MFLFVRPISLCSSVFPHFENLEFVCKAPEIRNHLEEEAGLWGCAPIKGMRLRRKSCRGISHVGSFLQS
jgi:hypothetical protein